MKHVLAAAVVFASALGVTAQESVPTTYTEAQAAAGKAAFAKSCAACHMPDLSGNNEVPQLAGESFMGTWGDRTTKEFFEYMSGAMPPGGPALTVDAYEAIAALILKSNGAPAGGEKFAPSADVRVRDLTTAAK